MSEAFSLSARALPAAEIARILESDSEAVDRYLGEEIYANRDRDYLARQRQRLAQTARMHAERVGEAPAYLLRAPGRLNAFLEYLDMCAGDHMSTTIDGDIPVAVSVREDDVLDVANSNPLFPPERISIEREFMRFCRAPWGRYSGELEDTWDNRTLVYPHYGRPQGAWTNYLLSPYMRVLWEDGSLRLRGANLTFGPATAPFRAGTSSSSAVVVLGFLALWLSNAGRLPKWRVQEVCRLLGEAEWYVGTHGGANDQTTILRNPCNSVLYNRHSRADLDSTPLPFLQGIHVVLANSLWEVNKTLGGNQSFNMRKGWMEMGDELMKLIIRTVREAQKTGRTGREGWLPALMREKFGLDSEGPFPLLENHSHMWEAIEANYRKFGSLDESILGVPDAAIEELIKLLPVKIRPEEAARIFGKDPKTICKLYTKPRRRIGGYHLRTTARFFHKENKIGRELERIFIEAEQRTASGELSPDSPEYDSYRIRVGQMVDELQDILCFDFRVSIPQIDLLLTIARRGPGYLGGKLTGAGKGGCVSLLVRESDSAAMCEHLDRNYYGKPEHFEFYRQVLKDELTTSKPGSIAYESARERLEILDGALASIPEQRRVITFSRGACALEFPVEN